MTSPRWPAGDSAGAGAPNQPSKKPVILSLLDTSVALQIIVCSLTMAAAILTLLAVAGLKIDLAVAGLFYDPETQTFLGNSSRYVAFVREHGMVAVGTCIAVIVLALMSLLPWRVPSLRIRSAAFLTAGMLLGPGLLCNVLLKPNGGRPRPFQVTQFGGPWPYVDWWDFTGACRENCSFMSGEAATAAWLFGPALLVPAPWRALAIVAAAVFTTVISLGRMATGSHFLSDAILGVLSTILILLTMRALIDPVSPASRLNSMGR